MNERIKALAEQADVLEYKTYHDPSFSKSITNADKINKFVELIVKECIRFGHDDNGWKPDYKIKEHFGVE